MTLSPLGCGTGGAWVEYRTCMEVNTKSATVRMARRQPGCSCHRRSKVASISAPNFRRKSDGKRTKSAATNPCIRRGLQAVVFAHGTVRPDWQGAPLHL